MSQDTNLNNRCKHGDHVRAPLDPFCIHCGTRMKLKEYETYNCFGTIIVKKGK